MSAGINKCINSCLPREILPGGGFNKQQDSDNYIKQLILESIPPSDSREIKTALNWSFLLSKHSLKKKKTQNRRKTFLTREQRKEIGLLKLPKSQWNYDELEQLRDTWKGYMKQNLELLSKPPDPSHQDWTAFSTLLSKSELIGAEVKIIKSKILNQVGMSGTIVLETKMTLQIVTRMNELKCIVKDSAVFEFRLDNIRFIVYGKRIMTRPNERSIKKIRTTMAPIL